MEDARNYPNFLKFGDSYSEELKVSLSLGVVVMVECLILRAVRRSGEEWLSNGGGRVCLLMVESSLILPAGSLCLDKCSFTYVLLVVLEEELYIQNILQSGCCKKNVVKVECKVEHNLYYMVN